MQRVANDLIAASRMPVGADEAFATVLRSHADVPAIGLSALGSYASVLPKTDRPGLLRGHDQVHRPLCRQGGAELSRREGDHGRPVARDHGRRLRRQPHHAEAATATTCAGAWSNAATTYKVREAEIIGFEMTSFLNNMFQNYINDNGGNPRVLVLALNR